MPVYWSAPPKLLRVVPSEIDCVIVPLVEFTVQEVGSRPVPGVFVAVMSAGTTELEFTTVPMMVTFSPTTAHAGATVFSPKTGSPSAVAG